MSVATCKTRGPSDSFLLCGGGGHLGGATFGWDIQLFFAWEVTDGVVTTHHVLKSGKLVVAGSWFVAGHGGVSWVAS